MFRGSQGLVLSLVVSCESKSLLIGIWQQKGWLTVAGRGLSSKAEESPSGDVFSNRCNLQVARCDA